MRHKEKASAQSCQILITTAPRRAQEESLKAVLLCPRMIRIRRDYLDEILQPYDAGQESSWSHLV
jgi:hypothetical protein